MNLHKGSTLQSLFEELGEWDEVQSLTLRKIMLIEYCDCDCHGNDNIVHVAACCYMCPTCRGHIVTDMYDEHVERCAKEQEEFMRRKPEDHTS